MSDEHMILLAPCYLCGSVFESNPLTVRSIRIDPQTKRPPDLDAQGQPCEPEPGSMERSRREPVCPLCVEKANVLRAERGLPPWPEPPGQLAAEVGW